MQSISTQTRILIVKLSSIGDVVHALPTLVALRRHFPQAYIAWLVEEKSKDIVLEHPLLDEVLIFPKERWRRDLKDRPWPSLLQEVRGFIRDLRSRRFDIAIDLQGLLRSGILTWLSGAKVRVGFADTREFNSLFMNRLVRSERNGCHAIETYLDVARSLGAEGSPTDTMFYVSQAARDFADRFLKEHGVQEGDILVALNPSTSWQSKCWTVEGYAGLGDALQQKWGAKVVIFGSPSDVPLVQSIVNLMATRPIVAAGATSLKELAAIVERSDLFVGGDTGPMQIAVAIGTPVVALFGPTSPKLTGPVGEGHIVLQKEYCCSRERRNKRVCLTHECMRWITVTEVMAAVEKQLARKGKLPVSHTPRGGDQECPVFPNTSSS